jgi:hypothetical protein
MLKLFKKECYFRFLNAGFQKNKCMAKKSSTIKLTDAGQVDMFMESYTNPLKPEVEALRKIIKSVDKRINERIKWNAPSYYYIEDMVTFGPPRPGKVILVFHHPFIVNVQSDLLEGDYKDRRLVNFKSMEEIRSNKKELVRIVSELVKAIENK